MFSHRYGYEGTIHVEAGVAFAADQERRLLAGPHRTEMPCRPIRSVGAHATPAVTPTDDVRQTPGAGALAASILLDMLDGRGEQPRQVILPTQLVIRSSCGASPA